MLQDQNQLESTEPIIDRLNDVLSALEPSVEGPVPRKETIEQLIEVVRKEVGDKADIQIQWYGDFPRILAFIK